MKFSFFKNAFADVPEYQLSLLELIDRIKNGEWKKQVTKVRGALSEEKLYKRLKGQLPAVTVSGEFKTRDKQLPIETRLKKHSGLICVDVDKKDNPRLRTDDVLDKEAVAQYLSCSGEGLKIIYYCKPVKTAEEHRRIFDAVVQRLEKKKIKINLDPIVKSIASLQYVSYDPQPYLNLKSRLVLQPVKAVKRKPVKVTKESSEIVAQLEEYLTHLGTKDITANYEEWLMILFGLGYTLGEAGREIAHKISCNYPEYSKEETDEKYSACLETKVENPVTIATVFSIINKHLPKPQRKALAKKFNINHAVGVGETEATANTDLGDYVKFKLFLFKKIFDRQTNTLAELVPVGINLNALEQLLRELQFYRFEERYVHVINNIVDEVDADDILRILTEYITNEGDYQFSYGKLEFHFSWEELVHLWRTIRAQGTTYNQIAASLDHWEPNLLKDGPETSYIPYINGVVEVTKESIKLIPYSDLKQQIWRERILNRHFKPYHKAGMFEKFFIHVTGRGKSDKERESSINYSRAKWYYGYMLHGVKRQSISRAWILYDAKTGNNGGTGKTIIGKAIGKIRSQVVIDGKQVDVQNRFAFQTVQPWTEVVFIDDPSRFMSLVPLFNMITGDLSADRKGKEPVVKAVKFMIASNWVLEAEGTSETRRQFVTQLSDFYVQWAKDHNDSITPVLDYHGKEFFTDWNENDWAAFDNFAVNSLQHYFKTPPPEDTILGDALMLRFIQLHEQELFFELATAFIKHVADLSNGQGVMIPSATLITVVQEHNDNIKSNKAGRIAREFLLAIGGKKVELTTGGLNGRAVTMYKLPVKYSELSFGAFEERLPKRK